MASKLEINIRSLIVHCEEIVKEDPKNWLLKKYIKSLDTMIKELEDMTEADKPKATTLDEYKTRCANLKTEINYVEPPKLESRLKLKTNLVSSDSVVQEINQLQDAKYTNSLRRDLLGANATESNRLRKRVTGSGSGGGDDMNQAMKHHANLQGKITEDMLALTRNLKEQTETANRIIRKDTEIVSKSATLSEMNYTSLSKEATTLQHHSRRAWKCWMWIMIGLVMVIFIFMVLFMKVMKKRTT